MKKIFLLVCSASLLMSSYAQKQVSATPYAKSITGEGLKKHLTIIAADDMEGRETGKAGQRKAAAYIEEQFKKIGIISPKSLNGYQQFYPLNQDSLSAENKLTIDGAEAVFGKDFISPLSLNTNGSFNGKEIVFVGYGIDDDLYNDYANKEVKSKIVVFCSGEPKKGENYLISESKKTSQWTYPGLKKKLEVAFEKGAIGALYINASQASFSQQVIRANTSTNVYYPDNTDFTKRVNCATLSHDFAVQQFGNDFATYIEAASKAMLFNDIQFEKKSNVSMVFDKKTTTVNASNVIGVIEGTDKKEEYVFLTAHYDHLGVKNGVVYNGADDDGSGTVTVIQMAEAFAKAKKEGKGPRRTVVFMTVSGEEKGLWGSEYYADNPVFPLEKTSVDLNIDMIGRVDTERKSADTLNYVYVVGHDKLSTELPGINEKANANSSKLVLDYKFDDPNDPNRIYYRSDHYNFAKKGVPVLFFYDGMLKADYHKPTDDIDKINWTLFEKRAQMIFTTAWDMANRDEMLKRDIPLNN